MKKLLCIISLLISSSSFAVSEYKLPAYEDPLDSLKYRLLPYPASEITFIDENDPLESMNRSIYRFNAAVDEYVYIPVVDGYKTVVPLPARSGINNFFNNLEDIATAVNLLLQGEFKKTVETTGRVVVNTTMGLVGLFDVGSQVGLTRYDADFGQTLGVYGVGSGPYIVVPFIGPKTTRSATGIVADIAIQNELNYLGMQEYMSEHIWSLALYGIDMRYSINFAYGDVNSAFEYDLVRFLIFSQDQLKVDVARGDQHNATSVMDP